jgi:hypothetical protein
MSDVGLYFPYVNLPSDAWVKAAALHWPQLGRIRPIGYWNLQDSDVVKRLRDELDFVLDVRPMGGRDQSSWAGDEVWERLHPRFSSSFRGGVENEATALFFDFLHRHKEELIPRCSPKALGVEIPDPGRIYDEMPSIDPRLEEIHWNKFSYMLSRQLIEDGLLVSIDYQWRRKSDKKVIDIREVAMHRQLARVFLAVLADIVAKENKMIPVTEQEIFQSATSGWTVDSMAQILLTDAEDPKSGTCADYSQAFSTLALQTVVPRDLESIPVERIIEARKRLLPDLIAYRGFLGSLTPDFVEISQVRDPEVRAAKLGNHVESKVKQPIERMERELGRLGLQPVRAVLSLQSLAPPAAIGVLGETAGLPPLVTAAGVVAGCLVGATNSAIDQRRKTLAGHPTGYLLSLRHELAPSDGVARVRSAMRRAVPKQRR